MIEVTVAIVLLTFGALALAGGVATGERARQAAVARGFALAAAESWLEGWRAGAWPQEGQGQGTIAWMLWSAELRWRATQPSACLAVARVEVDAGRSPVVLETKRYLEGEPGCGG